MRNPRGIRWALASFVFIGLTAIGSEARAEIEFDWAIYEDVGFESSLAAGKQEAGFELGEIDFFARSQLTERISLLSETMVMINEAGRTMIHPVRLYVQYQLFSQRLAVRVGRIHTPVGYYTDHFPHGARVFQLLTHRPNLLSMTMGAERFYNHVTGLDLSGGIDVGELGRLKYNLFTGNGGLGLGLDTNLYKQVGARVAFEFYSGVPDLELGVSGYIDRIPPEGRQAMSVMGMGAMGALPGEVREVVLVGHLVYLGYPAEAIAEFFYIGHESAAGGRDVLLGGFAQVGWEFDRYTPFVRYEQWSRDPDDPVYQVTLDMPERYLAVEVGLRIRLHEKNVLKVKYTYDLEESTSHAGVQLAYAF